jgi:hypothetical protein
VRKIGGVYVVPFLFVLLVFVVVVDGRPVLFAPVPVVGEPVPVVGLTGGVPVACEKPDEENKPKPRKIVNTRTHG